MANGALSTGNPLKWIDYLRFGWFDPLMKLGALTTLQKEDIWYTEPRDLPENIVAELEPLWNREVERARALLDGRGEPPYRGRLLIAQPGDALVGQLHHLGVHHPLVGVGEHDVLDEVRACPRASRPRAAACAARNPAIAQATR